VLIDRYTLSLVHVCSKLYAGALSAVGEAARIGPYDPKEEHEVNEQSQTWQDAHQGWPPRSAGLPRKNGGDTGDDANGPDRQVVDAAQSAHEAL
jgi:hypothetical protein